MNTRKDDSSNDLGLTDVNGGCACCGTGSTSAASESNTVTASTDASYGVVGMTCGHCVSSVTEEISEITGVTGVDVDLSVGGTSTVTVSSSVALDDAIIRAAVEEAGYEFVELPR